MTKNGESIEVVIDDKFPCDKFRKPAFSKANGNELWVMILEKAFAKYNGFRLLWLRSRRMPKT